MLEHRYTTLRITGDQLPTSVVGSFPVEVGDEVLGRFLVEIDLPADYPNALPTVREVGGAIPHHLDRHNPNGRACLFHAAAYWLDGYHQKPFSVFLEGPVRSFFLFQCCYEAGVRWPHGEQAHGTDGAVDFFAERIGVDVDVAVRCIQRLQQPWPLSKHELCPCKSGRSVRRCHPRLLNVANRLPRSALPTLAAGIEART